MRGSGGLLQGGLAAFVAYPESLECIVLELALVRGDEFPIRRDRECKLGAGRPKPRHVVCADRYRELRAGRVGDVLLAVIFGERPAALRQEHLRDDHARALECPATHRAIRLRRVVVFRVADKAARIAMDNLLNLRKQRLRPIVNGG
jgi:hypothetical protein